MSSAAQPAGEFNDIDRAQRLAELAAQLEGDLATIARAEPPEPEARPATRADVRRVLELPAALDELSERAAEELRARNSPPRLFDRMGALVRIDRPGAPLEVLNEHRLRYELAEACTFVTKNIKGEARPASPPKELAQNLIAAPPGAWRLPKLHAVKGGPVFNRSGELLTRQGYHEAEGIIVSDAVQVECFEGSGAGAAQWLFDEIFPDFPFEDQASRANALAYLLTLVARDLAGGLAPLCLVSSPVPGAGKDLFIKTACAGTVGLSRVIIMPWSENAEEARKALWSTLALAPEAIVLDNVKNSLDDPSLAAVLTAPVYTDRVLGRSEMQSVEVAATFAATAINPAISTEMTRRIYEVRLNPQTDRPWDRQGFKHPDLIAFAEASRGRIFGALERMVQEWLTAGRPAWSGGSLGSFETWSRTIGGILESNRVQGFLANRGRLIELADIEGQAWREFVEEWAVRFGEREVLSSELYEIARTIDALSFRGATDRAQAANFGRRLAKLRDRYFGPWRVLRVPSAKHGGRYRLARGSGEVGGAGEHLASVPCARARASGDRAENTPQLPLLPQEDFFDEVGETELDV